MWFQKLKENLSYFRGNLLILTLSWVLWSPAMVMVYTYEPVYIIAFEADLIPRLRRGNVMATLMLVSGITTAIATTIGGLGYKEITQYFPFFISMALLLIGFSTIIFRIREPSKREI